MAEVTVEVRRGRRTILAAIAEEWRALRRAASPDDPFHGPAWVMAYLDAFAPEALLRVYTAHADGSLVGVLPLVECRPRVLGVPVRMLRAPANVHSVSFDLTVAPGLVGVAAKGAIADAMRHDDNWDVIELEYLIEGNGLADLSERLGANGCRADRTEVWRSLHVRIDPVTRAWDAQLRREFRKKLARRRRRLEERGRVSLRRYDAADRDALERFYRLEQSGWKGCEGTAIACRAETRRFYDTVAANASRDGELSLYFLQCNDRDVAAQFGLSCGNRYLLLKAAYDEEYRRFGPGHLLMREVLADCRARGLEEFDFLGPSAPDEHEWAHRLRGCQQVRVFRPGVFGTALHAVMCGPRRAARLLLRRLVPGGLPPGDRASV